MSEAISNVPKASLLAPGGCVVGPDPGDPICAAYQAALDEWCAVGPAHRNSSDASEVGKPRNFNDMVFKHLDDPGLAKSRELPLGIAKGETVTGALALLGADGPAGEAAAELATWLAERGPLGASGLTPRKFVLQGRGAVKSKLGAHFDIDRVLFPDGFRLPPGRAIEIKRPTETEHPKGQLRRYAEASPTGTCELVNCAACELECAQQDGDCPKPT